MESITKLLADSTQLREPQLDILSVAVIVVSLFMNVKVSGSALRIKSNARDIADSLCNFENLENVQNEQEFS